MIGTRLDDVDEPRLIPSEFGWWFIGNGTWTLVTPESVSKGRIVDPDVDRFLHDTGAYRPPMPTHFSLTVLTTTSCNLGCGYCFQNTALDSSGGTRPPRIARQRLTPTTIERIVHFTASQMERAGFDKLYLLLFGGEPLLNRAGCLQLLDGVQPIGLSSAMVATNGVLLSTELAEALEARGLTGVQLTFDGSRDDHDKIRISRTGTPTFDKIVHNLVRVTTATKLRWHLRVNVSHHNFARISMLFDQLLEARVDPSRCSLTFAWVGDAGFGYDNELGQVDEVSEQFVAWSIKAIEIGFHLVRPSMKTTCQICSKPGGKHGAVVNADGALYSCWQSAGKASFAVGDIDSGYTDVDQVRDRWVTCGYEYAQNDHDVVTAFQDRVDGSVLDYLHASGRL